MKSLWEKLQDIGLLKRSEQHDMSAEAARFKSEPAYAQYLDEARFSLINQLWALNVEDIDKFQELKRCQLALSGLDDFIETQIMNERMRSREGAR